MWTGPSFVGVVNEGEGGKRVMNENDDEMFFGGGVFYRPPVIKCYGPTENIPTTRALDLDVHLPIENDLQNWILLLLICTIATCKKCMTFLTMTSLKHLLRQTET